MDMYMDEVSTKLRLSKISSFSFINDKILNQISLAWILEPTHFDWTVSMKSYSYLISLKYP